MNKFVVAGLMAGLLSVGAMAYASPLVTSNIPLDSPYYQYLDKLEGMGYIEDITMEAKPYSRLDVAKWLVAMDTTGMEDYLLVYYNEMAQDLAPEMEYLKSGADSFDGNLKLRNAEVKYVYYDGNSANCDYEGANASFQPLNKNNNGYRYGDGSNGVASFNISGSINEDVALSLTPRFSYDKDQNGDASLVEGYVKTHLGVWSIEAGKQPLLWGGKGHNDAFAYSNNATPHTMLKIGLLEPHTFDNGFLKFLGKANVNVFYTDMGDNRLVRFHKGTKPEPVDDMSLIGMRVDVAPTDYFAFGLERVSMVRKFNKDWFLGDNAESSEDEGWNDIAGIDVKLKFPGMQVYGSVYGEDQANYMPSDVAYSAGLYFPQLSSDGKWDLRLEAAKTTDAWYRHGNFVDGWTYKDDIMGSAMGGNAREFTANIHHYMDNGDRIGLTAVATKFNRSSASSMKMMEYQVNYAKKLNKNMYLDLAASLAKVENKSNTDLDDNHKMVGAGLRWEF